MCGTIVSLDTLAEQSNNRQRDKFIALCNNNMQVNLDDIP